MDTLIHSVSGHDGTFALCRKFIYELKRDYPSYKHEGINTDWQYTKGKPGWNNWGKVTCPVCIANHTPGSSLYRKVTAFASRELPIDKRFATAIAAAMKETDAHRRAGWEDFSLAAAMTALMEAMNLHIAKEKCLSCNGKGKVSHQHSMYCYREAWGGNVLDCSGGPDQCTSCSGKGFISEDLFKE